MTSTGARRIVDISMPLENDVISDLPGYGPKIEYVTHQSSARDVMAFFPGLEDTLQPFDIVLVNTRAGSAYGTPGYVAARAGMGREATLSLLERGVRVTGTDAWSWDAPFVHTKEKFSQSGDARLIWEGHKAGREIGDCHLEKRHNLEALPAHGFTVVCFPVKIRGASAGAVAIL